MKGHYYQAKANEGKCYCPMKCEGDKTYDQSGNCPVCNMNLVLAGEAQSKCC